MVHLVSNLGIKSQRLYLATAGTNLSYHRDESTYYRHDFMMMNKICAFRLKLFSMRTAIIIIQKSSSSRMCIQCMKKKRLITATLELDSLVDHYYNNTDRIRKPLL